MSVAFGQVLHEMLRQARTSPRDEQRVVALWGPGLPA